MEASTAPARLQLADRPLMEAHGEFVRFKSTCRAHYDVLTPTAPGVFDSVLFNEQGWTFLNSLRGWIAAEMVWAGFERFSLHISRFVLA